MTTAAPTGQKPAILNLKDWRKLKVRTFTTADGLELTLRTCTVLDLAEEGAIPQAMLAKLQSMTEEQMAAAGIEHMDDFARMVNALVAATVKRPRVLSRQAANDLIDAIHKTFAGTAVSREQVAEWLDEAMLGDAPAALAGPERAELVARYTGAILVEEIAWEDRQAIFDLAMAGVGPAATFPTPEPGSGGAA